MIPKDIALLADDLLAECRRRGLMMATAESCTGGLIAACFTEIAGSSDVFERGFVTYSNEAKHALLGVPPQVIAEHGAVSRKVAELMARGALAHSGAGIAVAVTGIAGPGGGSPEKPVGTVHIAVASRDDGLLHEECAFGDPGRTVVREETVRRALALLRRLLDQGAAR